MPPPIGRRRILEFQRAFVGEVDSLAALYRSAGAEMIAVLGDASANLFARQRAVAHLRQYQTVLAELGDEAAAWIETNIPRAYNIGLQFADHGAHNIRRAGINLQRRQREVFSQVHREAVAAITEEMLRSTEYALAQIGRRVDDVFRRVGMEEVARGIVAGRTRRDVTREIKERLLTEAGPRFVDRSGRAWDLDRYAEMAARTTTREAMTQGTINRLREHGVRLAQVSAHNAPDFCLYYENVVVNIGDEPHPVYPPLSAINGGPPFHPNCVHVLTPFVERLATPEERKAGIPDAEVLNKSPGELQRRFRAERPARARRAPAAFRRQRGRRRPEAPPPPPWEKPLQAPGRGMTFEEARRDAERQIEAMREGVPLTGLGNVDAAALKNEIVESLHARLRDDPVFLRTVEKMRILQAQRRYSSETMNAIDTLLHQWAITSGDHNSLSVAMQMAWEEEFGIKGSAKWWSSTTVANAQYYLDNPEFRAGLRRFARVMYDETQAYLARQGVEEVVLYRGIAFDQPPPDLRWSGRSLRGGSAQVRMQPVSSFSADYETAWDFALSHDGEYKAVLMARVPRERIAGMARSGYGCFGETEWVVLGGEPSGNEVAAATWRYRGEGSPPGANATLRTLVGD